MAHHIPNEQFANLEIHILPKGSKGYPVDITLDDRRFKRGYLTADILPWVTSGVPSEDGKQLFNLLVTDGLLRSAWDRSRERAPQRRIRLRIDQEATKLHTLPWELLQEGPTMLSASENTPFSRYLQVEEPWEQTVTGPPVRMLVVISNPNDLAAKNLPLVDVAREQKALEKVFETASRQFSIEFLDAPVTLERLEAKLRQSYHVLHFIGHGAFSIKGEKHALYLQQENGQAQRVQDEQFVGMLARQGVRPQMVFLIACQSATRSTDDAFLGLGPQLAAAGVPNVIAMQDVVTVETARKFSVEFYEGLLQHGLVDLAVNQARSTLLTIERYDAGVPVLFMRDKQSVLFQRLAEARIKPQPDTAMPRETSTLAKLDDVNPIKLREAMAEVYDKPSLTQLCSDLAFEYDDRSVEYDSLRGESLPSKILYLIDWHRRRRRLPNLARKVLKDFPFLSDTLA